MGSESTGIVTRSIQTISGKRGDRKGLQHYIFHLTPPSTYTVLSGKDADCLKKFRTNFKVTLGPLDFHDGSEFFHFVSDPRQIIDDYRNAGIKLLTRYESKQDFLDKKRKELEAAEEKAAEEEEAKKAAQTMNPMHMSSKGSEE